jgi:hypothetical protein
MRYVEAKTHATLNQTWYQSILSSHPQRPTPTLDAAASPSCRHDQPRVGLGGPRRLLFRPLQLSTTIGTMTSTSKATVAALMTLGLLEQSVVVSEASSPQGSL